MIGDSYCDESCNKKEFFYDKGDCLPVANIKECLNFYIGNGVCDK